MSRGKSTSTIRCAAVWLLVTAVAAVAWSAVSRTAASLASPSAWHGTFEDLLVAIASVALLACAGWLWVVTTVTVTDVARGRLPSAPPQGVTRRLVLMACGVAVVAGVGSPALAASSADPGNASSSGSHSLVGLPMPDRAVAGSVPTLAPAPAPAPAPAAVDRPAPRTWSQSAPDSPGHSAGPITVRAGDSLWSIAAAQLGPDAEIAEIDAAWRGLYAANHRAIGDDADLILPGLDLDPATTSDREARP